MSEESSPQPTQSNTLEASQPPGAMPAGNAQELPERKKRDLDAEGSAAQVKNAVKKSNSPVVLVRSSKDKPSYVLLGAVGSVCFFLGFVWPKACGVVGAAHEEATPSLSSEPISNVPSAIPSLGPSAVPSVTASVALSASVTPADSNDVASVTVGKSTMISCQDPPLAEMKPSRCGDPMLDNAIVPKVEQLAACPAAKGVTGKLSLGVDVNFKTQTLRILSGRSSALLVGGRRDDRANEPLLVCARALLKDFMANEASTARDHARYLVFFPVTFAPSKSAPEASSSVNIKENAATGTAQIKVEMAIVRAQPNAQATIVTRIPNGTSVTIVGKSGHWYHVKTGENLATEGWLFHTTIGK